MGEGELELKLLPLGDKGRADGNLSVPGLSELGDEVVGDNDNGGVSIVSGAGVKGSNW